MVIFLPIVLVVFFGVGLIGSTQSFAPFSLENYFALAVAGSLVTSAILGWYITLLGGSKTGRGSARLARDYGSLVGVM